jgi:uncharacterized BrkB/YihY/UPF0761 family membrane protein
VFYLFLAFAFVCVFLGIFAFKCVRAEEIFNMLQEVMHSHSISVVEEAVLEANHQSGKTLFILQLELAQL